MPSSNGNEQATIQTTDESSGGKNHKKWIVLIAAFTTIGIATGFPFNMSVLYVEWLQEFGKSNSETALVQSVCTGLFLIGGIGFSLSYISASTSVGLHFEGKQRLMALAFISSGGGVGASVLPILL
ncbi:Hypothetical predicted protein [Mytilus galloprovincialis]|uniref:Major facilitator superfamily (MFS) profile domain-containing protein n=1 Tax=Mytilus galloprovincialis TaxID=29158 RepID=A0A8B6EV22_MYTGA|nr:Hypothetical predicted protein [Mytilus galloprovincialis]